MSGNRTDDSLTAAENARLGLFQEKLPVGLTDPNSGEELSRIVRNYALQLPSDAIGSSGSINGLIATGDARQITEIQIASTRSRKEQLRDYIYKQTQIWIEAMRRSLDEQLARIDEEISALNVEREETDIEITRARLQRDTLNQLLEAAQRGIDRIKSGDELEVLENGRLADAELEQILNAYEASNGASIDRNDSALLLAVLKAEQKRMIAEQLDMNGKLQDLDDRLCQIDQKIADKQRERDEAEAFRSKLDEIEAMEDPEQRERALHEIVRSAPSNILNWFTLDETLTPELRTTVTDTQVARREVTEKDLEEVNDLIDELEDTPVQHALAAKPPTPTAS